MEKRDNLLEVVKTLFRYKKFLLATVGLVGLGAVIIVLLLPVYYESTAKFYPASQDLAAPENIFGRSTTRTYYYGTDEDAERVLGIAESAELANFLIDSFDLYRVYDIDTSDSRAPYYVMETFEEFYKVKQTKENAIEISMEDEAPERAAKIVNAAFLKINEIGQRLIKESQKQTLEAIEKGFMERGVKLKNIEDSLQNLRRRYAIYNVETQGEGLSNLIIRLQSNIQSDSARIKLYQLQRNRQDSIRKIQVRLAGASQQLRSLEGNLEKFNEGLSRVASLIEQQEIASIEFAVDQEQYNRVNSAYNSNFPTLLVLESGRVPVIKSRPKRTLIVLASVIIAFIFSVLGILIFDSYRDVDWKGIVNQ